MIKRSIIISILIIFASILFNFSYSQTSTSSATSSDATTSKEKGDVYARASETYKYVSSFDGTSDSKTFDNQNTKEIGSLFNYLLTLMAIFIVILVIYRLVQGALFKGIFDNIYDQKKGRKYIQTAGTALVIFILAYAVLSFINPDLTGWTLATDFIGKKRIEGMVRNTGMCTGNSLAGTDVAQLIRQNEGFVACPYKDSKGIATIGIGYNLTNSSARKDLENAGITNIDAIMNYQAGSTNCPANAPKITEAQAIKLLENYLPKARATAVDFAGGESEFQSHPEDMQKILIDMAYNLGEARFNGPKGFNNMKAALRNHNYVDVAKEMVNSDWYTQVGNRAKELVKVVEGFTCNTGSSGSLSNMKGSSGNTDTKLLLSAGLLNDTANMTCPSGTKDLGTVKSKYTGSGQVKGPLIRLCQLTGIIDGKGNDTSGKNVTNGAVVNVIAAQHFIDLAKAAKAAGVVFRSTSSFRYEDSCVGQYGGNYNNPTYKEKVASGYCAPAGSSLHQLGIAIDILELYDNLGPPAKIKGGTCSGTRATASKNDNIFNWLKDNASKYQIYNYASEVWHWEFSPPSNNRC